MGNCVAADVAVRCGAVRVPPQILTKVEASYTYFLARDKNIVVSDKMISLNRFDDNFLSNR